MADEARQQWDHWEQQALHAGVGAELAALGRQVMRDHAQHGRGLEDPEQPFLGARGEYVLQLALQAPVTAYLEFNAALIWGEASGRDGDVEAFRMLVERLGSDDQAEAALAQEGAAVEALKREHGLA